MAEAAALPGEKRAILVDLSDAATQSLIRIIHWVLRLAPAHRLTEPIRAAHAECNRLRRGFTPRGV